MTTKEITLISLLTAMFFMLSLVLDDPFKEIASDLAAHHRLPMMTATVKD